MEPRESLALSWDGRVTEIVTAEEVCAEGTDLEYTATTTYAALVPLLTERATLIVPFWRPAELCELDGVLDICDPAGWGGCYATLKMCPSAQSASTEIEWPASGEVAAEITIGD